MNDLKQRILDYTQRSGYKPLKAGALAKKLGITKKQMPAFRAAFDEVLAEGQLHRGDNGRVRAKTAAGMVAGILKRTNSGAGYLMPHATAEAPRVGRENDVYIDARDIGDAHTGDEVLVRLLKRRKSGGQRTGRVEEVLARATNTFVGTYFEREGQGYVQVDGRIFTDPIVVGDPGAKGVQPNDKVVIEMLRFPSHALPGEAVLTEVLGARGKPGVDTLSIIHEFGLPDEFPEEVLAEAREQAERFEESHLDGRRDLTKETIVTIDPVDARDFDDAISLSRSDDGHWHLGVHIADVAHFVPAGSALDREAYRRGTSVYLPTRVLPMLPEVISNGLASLQAGKLRYAKSAFIEFTPEGVPVGTSFSNSAIKVTRRFAYEEVLPVVREPDRFKAKVSAKVRALLGRMYELAMILRRRRFERGAINLSLREVKLDFDTEGRVIGAHEVEHDESHQIIEEFMLAANVAVATELADRKVAFLRRVHGDPDLLKLESFAKFATVLGYPLKRFQSRTDLQGLLDRVQGQPEEHAINFALLRSMKQAEYAAVELGHYALAEENYCHFTSPIRRYPDLTIHRLVGQLVASRKKPHGPNDLELAKIGKQCSATERRAQDAERELTKVKLLTFMVDRVGEELDAVITGVESFGMFCKGVQIPAEGLIHISALDRDDFFYHDQEAFSLVGRRSGKQYRLGDKIRVCVARVDVDRRELDFALAGSLPAGDRAKQTGPRQAARDAGGDRRGRPQKGGGSRNEPAGQKGNARGQRRAGRRR